MIFLFVSAFPDRFLTRLCVVLSGLRIRTRMFVLASVCLLSLVVVMFIVAVAFMIVLVALFVCVIEETPPPAHFGVQRFVCCFSKWRLLVSACRFVG